MGDSRVFSPLTLPDGVPTGPGSVCGVACLHAVTEPGPEGTRFRERITRLSHEIPRTFTHLNRVALQSSRSIIESMDLRPLHDHVLVTRLEEVEQRQGGIIIPDSAKEKPQQAEVHAVGNGKLLETGERVPLEVKAGDRILFGKYSGSEIKIAGREYLILKEDEILGVLE